MNIIDTAQFALARWDFNGSRDKFYHDLAEAVDDGESVAVFLASARDFCVENNRPGHARIYETLLRRMNEKEGRMSHFLRTVVPEGDLLSITAIDSAPQKLKGSGLRDLAAMVKAGKLMRKKFRKALVVPSIMLPVIIAFAFLNAEQVPILQKMLPDTSKWPPIGHALMFASDAITNHGMEMAIGATVAFTIFIRSFPRWTSPFRRRLDRYLPYRIYRESESANFLTSLATLLKNGKILVEALAQMRENASPWMRWHIEKILHNLDIWPGDYAKAFDTALLSPELHMRLTAYARRGGDFSAGLVRLGTDGLEHVNESVDSTAAKLQFVSIIAATAAILFFYGGGAVLNDSITKTVKQEQLEAQ